MSSNRTEACNPGINGLNQSQLGVYFECVENPESTMYNVPFAISLPKDTDIDRFENAVIKAASNHPALFATFKVDGGNPMMISGGSSSLTVTHSKAESIQQCRDRFVRPFDIENGPLFRFELCKVPEGTEFLLDIHHLVFDGTSLRILLNEISQIYAGHDIEPEDMSLAEFVSYETSLDGSNQMDVARNFFKSQFEGVEFESMVEPDATESGAESAMIEIESGNTLSHSEIADFCNKAGVTESTFFQTAFAYSLTVFSGSEDCCFVTGGSGRFSKRLSHTAGMFVKSLPVHMQFPEGATVRNTLIQARKIQLETRTNECMPFGELAHEYGANTNVSFVYQADLLSDIRIGDSYIVPVQLPMNGCQSDILFMLLHTQDGYMARMCFRQTVFTKEFMQNLADTVFTVADGMLKHDRFNDISLVSDKGRCFIDRINATECENDSNQTINELFEQVLKENEGKTAIVSQEATYSFHDLDVLSGKVRDYISSLGIGRDQFVGILVPRGAMMVIAAWGTIRSGAAFQPLDPTYPSERLDYMIQDSGTRLLIIDRSLKHLIHDFKGKMLFTDQIEGLPSAVGKPGIQVRPQDAVTMIYTSGTTGKPKGCILENRNLMAFYRNHTGIMGIDSNSKVASYASFGFDAGVMDVITTPMAGATICVIPDDIRLDLPRIEQYFCENNITNAFMTTQLGRMFAQQTNCRTLKGFLVGGEKLVPFTPPTDFAFINGYGPCETMGYICSHHVTDSHLLQPIGIPSGNTKLYTIDRFGRLLPAGAIGELCISGLQVGRGYLGLPEKTAATFTANPFDGDKPGYERMYRTGDMARLLPSSTYDFIGRRDGQVKIRGFRVELTEVEEIIRRYEGIKDATVAAFDDPAGGKYLAAYVVSDRELDTNDIAVFIGAEKPAYMIPAVIMQIESIPYTQNHKVNRRGLPAPVRKVVSAGDLKKPENDIERRIFDIAADILGRTDFGTDQDLFMAGMTSIGLLGFNANLSKAFSLPLKVQDIKKNSDIVSLARFIGENHQDKPQAMPVQSDYPLMQNQMGVFIECGMDKESLEYNVPLLVRFPKTMEAEKIQHAVIKAVNAHPYIKTILKSNEQGQIRAIRMDEEPVQINTVNLPELPPDNELVVPFTMLDSKLYRITIFVTDSGNYLFMDIHHIVSDGTSIGLLLTDIFAVLDGATLEKETFTCFESALLEEKARADASHAEHLAYFERLLDGCNTECLPQPCPVPGADSLSYSNRSYTLDGSKDIIRFCTDNSLSLNGFFNTVFGYTLARFIHSDNVTYCTVHNGRGDSRFASSFGMFVQTIPVSQNMDFKTDVIEHIRSVGAQLVDTMSAGSVSFAEIASKFGVKPNIFFNYQGDGFSFDDLVHKAGAEIVPIEVVAAKAPFSGELFLEKGAFRIELTCTNDCLCPEFLDSFASAFNIVAQSLLKCRTLGQAALLADSERAMFNQMNSTDAPFENVLAHTLFERMAAQYPDRMAAMTSTESITYSGLDAASNRIANALLKAGAGTGEIVGLIMDRTIMVPAAQIGIMKAGCAFLPMLPTYPDERLDYCMSDSGCRFVIATKDIIESRTELFGNDKPYKALALEEMLSETDDKAPAALDYDAHRLAYCIYTSGSTGTPKGVMIEQHNLTNFIQTSGLSQVQEHGTTILCMASISFDMSVSEIFCSLCLGKTLAIAQEDEIHNPDRLLELAGKAGVNIIMMTPSFAWNLLSMPQSEQALKGLKAVVLGAESFQPALFDRLKAINPDIIIQNGYGPTECTQVCSSKTLTDSKGITIGKPFANTAFYVMDDCGNMLPRYAVGELIICGEGVCRGYVNLPEKNAQTFFEIEGKRAYHSGDLVRVNRDLEVEFAGRKDNQVKLHGFRIELDEVENVMQQYPGVNRSKVVVRKNGNEDFLAAFFTASQTIDINDLTEFMKTKLTYYMVPRAMMQLDSMPMTAGGKLDAKALPEIRPAARKRGGRSPKKSLEEKITTIFQQVLGLDECFTDDNFFEMGGTSLSASSVVMQLKSAGYKIEYQDIFDHQTPQELAEYLEGPSAQEAMQTNVKDASAGLEDSIHTDEQVAETLKYNAMEYADQVERKPLGNILLTGASGFLGCHILYELLESEKGHIYCLMRKGSYQSSETRLKSTLFYYFDKRFDKEFQERITIVESDITSDTLAQSLDGISFDTAINCAASVKHYANDNTIEHVNVQGVANMIAICKAKGARLIQISTTSIPGAHNAETYRVHLKMTEDRLFVVDDMNNQYCRSKYKAELLMLSAIKDGMDGKIIRVGNLMGRHRDGEFQINMRTNAFLNGLRGFVKIGKCPISHSTDPMGFSPVDSSARAIVLLAGTNSCFTAFNADCRWAFDEMKVIEAVNRCGIKVTPVSDKEYYDDFYRLMADKENTGNLQALLTNDRPDIHIVETDNRFTTNVLYRLGFSWPFIDDSYLEKAISAIASLGFF